MRPRDVHGAKDGALICASMPSACTMSVRSTKPTSSKGPLKAWATICA